MTGAWNIGDLEANILAYTGAAKDAAGDALFELVEAWGEAGNRTVPIEEGILQNSMTTAVDRAALTAAVGWGAGAARAYAVRQHEDTTLRHDPGRGPKWGELAGRDIAAMAGDYIADKIRTQAGG